MHTVEAMTPVRAGSEWEAAEYLGEPNSDSLTVPDFTLVRPVMEQLHPDMKAVGSFVNRFLQNGARLYVDVGDHREYSTPPSEDFEEAITYTYAGEAELMDMVRRAQVAGKIGPYAVYRRVLAEDMQNPGHYTGLGYHLALGIRRRTDGVQNSRESRLLHSLHQATSSLYLGSGAIIRDRGGDWTYIKHQKEPCLDCEYHLDTMYHRPIINTRDESHAGPGEIRIHITSGDANHSPWQQHMAFAIGATALRMIDAGIRPMVTVPDGQLLKLMRLASRDMTLLKATLEKDGRPYRMTPHNVQEMIHERQASFLETHPVTKSERWGHQQRERVLSDVWRDSSVLTNRIDWAARLEYLGGQAALENDGAYWSSSRLRKIDQAYDLVGMRRYAPDDPDAPLDADEIRGFGVKLRSTQFSEWMPSDEAIQRARFEPPVPGRTGGQAIARSAFIKKLGRTQAEYKEHGRPDAIADWEAGKHMDQTYMWPLHQGAPTSHILTHDWRDTGEFVS